MFVWDPPKVVFQFNLPIINRPLVWYGVLFAVGFLCGYLHFRSLLKRFLPDSEKIKAKEIADRISVYVIVGMLVGARLGDILFYQSWSEIARDPFSIFRIWEGGLASHGGVLGLILAVIFFQWRTKKEYPYLSILRLYDLMVIPAALVGVFIRIGNFINQEIVGTPTTVPWAVIFLHPAGGSEAVPRHPVQLYEALFYLMLYVLFLCIKPKKTSPGKMTGIFLVLLFVFRFLIEYLKMEQSVNIGTGFPFRMGQILSLPFIIFGLILWIRDWKK